MSGRIAARCRSGTISGSWILTDDLVWEPRAPVRFRTEPDFLPIGSGWILGPFDANPITGEGDVGPGNIIPRIWYQPAEGEPVPIDITPMALPASVGNCGPGVALLSPNTIASGFGESCVEVGAWIITFDDVPA